MSDELKPCPWCKLDAPSMDVHCVCHARDCKCQPCVNGRYWRYLEAGPDAWREAGAPGGEQREGGDRGV